MGRKTNLTTKIKKTNKIALKQKSTKTTSKNKRKKKVTQLGRTWKAELKVLAQKNFKDVQKMYEKYGHGNMTTYGWYRFEKK